MRGAEINEAVAEMHSQRSQRELEALWALETSIACIFAQFKGEHAFNFSHEYEIAAHLLVMTRETFGATEPVGKFSVQLTRMEWRCLDKRDIDLVLLHPDAAEQARRLWGKGRSVAARELPLLAAVQVKRGGGNVTRLGQVKKDLKDLEQVDISPSLGKPMLYFLAWVDASLKLNAGLKEKERLKRLKEHSHYVAAKTHLQTWCEQSPEDRRAVLLSRDRVGFKFPREGWLTSPLPPGVIDLSQ